ncbi:Serine/threonine-protein kinase [Cordyceps fumosorosea ARSEF 2679]|uniref:Serine/threonine-protein kinase n=1 Tax=Cordyceps fumosorosea (strain ARSEF 2679) TaxID=1081104 RepID=A0A167RMW1_CORFA|nr:Serine/threonine-protein kinase [Cordyceps fumosorosea ARSEF 2679]OAA58751.1 Serine/threonine-protein kinase [Cordyceps fumosorosea ARSEF 2679]
MTWTIISVRAPTYITDHPHNSRFRTTEDAGLPDDRPAVVYQSEHSTPKPVPLPPDGSLCITTDHFPNDRSVGFVFDSESGECDVLLPSDSVGIGKQQFAITFNTATGAVILRNLLRSYHTNIRVEGQQLTRPWDDCVIGSPQYISFLSKLAQETPNLRAMLGDIIGNGVSSIVYFGSHKVTGDVVAIKRYDDNSSAAAAAFKEIGILATLSAHALHHLHSQGISHRDVKPENILIMTRYPIHAKLADFGVSSRASQHTTYCDTGRYAAPELARPPYTVKVDIWSMGVIVMELWMALPKQPDNTADRDEWTTIGYFDWQGRRIADRLDRAMVNLTQLLEAAGHHRDVLKTGAIRNLLPRDAQLPGSAPNLTGPFVPFDAALEVCMHLGVVASS